MAKKIIANISPEEVRMALLEDDELAEVFFERGESRRIAGNIYKGKIQNILPGMQAAFIDIGRDKNAFLYIGDIMPSAFNQGGGMDDVLTEGQDILVQIVKEPVGTKGPRATTHLTLPGRYVVLMPTVDYIGVSRRIGRDKERERLRETAEKVRPAGMGLIVRTVAEGKSEEELRQDVQYLHQVWGELIARSKKVKAPCLLYEDVDLLIRMVRDYLTEDVAAFVIDERNAYDKVRKLLRTISPEFLPRVSLYRGRTNIFTHYKIEEELEKISKRRVWLKSGGYLVIDRTEALTVIDVNTGKFVGSTCLADTVFRTNMEAADEICRQMRLRDMGGIIIVDFIDMDRPEHQKAVLARLEEGLQKDHTKTNVLGITPLGLVEMTRKRIGRGVENVLYSECPYCEGRGRVLSPESVAVRVKRSLRQTARKHPAGASLRIQAHPQVVAQLEQHGDLKRLSREFGRPISAEAAPEMHMEAFAVLGAEEDGKGAAGNGKKREENGKQRAESGKG